MIRPEVKEQIWGLREVIAALGFMVLSLWWALSSFGFMRWLAFGLALACIGQLGHPFAAHELRLRHQSSDCAAHGVRA